MSALEFLADEDFERELELRWRLLPYVIQYLNDDVIRTAAHSMTELLRDVPYFAEDLLKSLFEHSMFCPQQMAKDALAIPADEDFTVEELLEMFEMFEMLEAGLEEQPLEKTDWIVEGF